MFWGTDLSAPQRQFAGEPTGLLPNARQPSCRLPNDNLLGSRQVCSRTPDSRAVGSPTTICWGADTSAPERQIADLSVPYRRYAGEPTCLGSNADVRLVVANPIAFASAPRQVTANGRVYLWGTEMTEPKEAIILMKHLMVR